MKKIPFYNPASPLFFHIAVLLLYILVLSLWPVEFFMLLSILFFNAAYPFFAIAMAILIRRMYINTHRELVPEKFANQLVFYNRYLITVIYVFSFIVGLSVVGIAFLLPSVLFSSGLCFLFYLFILPIIIRLILLEKMSFIFGVAMVGIFFLLLLLVFPGIRELLFFIIKEYYNII